MQTANNDNTNLKENKKQMKEVISFYKHHRFAGCNPNEKRKMRYIPFRIAGAIALLALATGCATTHQHQRPICCPRPASSS